MLARFAFAPTIALSLAVATPLIAQQTDDPAQPPADPQVEPQNETQNETPAEPRAEARMTVARLGEIIKAIDPDARDLGGRMFELTLADVPILVVTDAGADRMRAMVPIRSAEGLETGDLQRMMQANFDTALDARYAVAQGRLWGVFIHPLSPLEKDQFLSGLAQTVSLAQTYGSLYTGGAAVYGGGDSNQIYQNLLEELRKKGEEI